MKQTMLISLAVVVVCTASALCAENSDEILGTWHTQDNNARVEIFKCENKYCARIISLKEPEYPAGSKDGSPGTSKRDHNNPDPALRTRPIQGLVFMRDFVYAGNNVWKGGRLYDPEKGKTYGGRLTLVSPNKLDLRGFIGISLFGRTSTWTR